MCFPEKKSNRRFNSAGTEKPGSPYENETDNYNQTHYQLFYNKKINSNWKFNTAVFATTGEGYYEQYKTDQAYATYRLPDQIINGNQVTSSEFIRQLWLYNIYYGTNFSFQFKKDKQEVIIGGSNSIYHGQHYGKLIWASNGVPKDHIWYDIGARKTEQHLFGKWLQQVGAVSIFGDVQIRNVHYHIDGFRNNPSVMVNNKWLFINPKAGIRYKKNGYSTYLSYALANKEPNRDDFEAGTSELPKHETLHDLEFGIDKAFDKVKVSATLYHMYYSNQLVLTGKINDVGAYTRTNIPKSYRSGIELETQIAILKWLSLNNNLALSQNKIRSFTEYVDDYDEGGQQVFNYKKTNLTFSPAVVYNAALSANVDQAFQINIITKYVSRQYLDNTSRKDRSLSPYLVQDLQFNYTLKRKGIKSVDIIFQVYNIWNNLYSPNGYTYSYVYGRELIRNNFYYPMAERNFLLGLNINL